jgi:hypothetical protein
MSEHDPDDGAWFEAKRYGYGSGPPIAWQGWVLLGGFILAAFALKPLIALLGPGSRPILLVGFLPLTAVFVVIVKRRTRGEWKWRWGGRR